LRVFQGRIRRMKIKKFVVIVFIVLLGISIGGTDQKTYAYEAVKGNEEVIYLTSVDAEEFGTGVHTYD
jgi:hypothetical protein